MKISCTQENLLQGLSVVSHIATKNVNLPILNNVLVKVEGSAVRLSTTNLEIAVSVQVRGKVDEEGEVTVPSKLFLDFVHLLPNERVDVLSDGDSVSVSSGTFKTKIKGMSSAEFPLIPQIKKEGAFRTMVSDFRDAIAKVVFAVSPNESRPEISGVLLRFSPDGPNGTLTLAATDSYRLAEAKIPLHEGQQPAGEQSVIVPARTLAEVLRILSSTKDRSDGPSTIEMVIAENQILFLYDTIEITSRTIEGNYPEYRAVVPEQRRTSATVKRDALIKAVKSASLFSRTGLYDVHLDFDPEATKMTLSATDTQVGEQEATIVPTELTGDKNTITLNYRYLLDGLNAMSADELTFEVVDGNTPSVMMPKGESASYLYLVMPIKV